MKCRFANYLLLSVVSMAVFVAKSHAQGAGQKTFFFLRGRAYRFRPGCARRESF